MKEWNLKSFRRTKELRGIIEEDMTKTDIINKDDLEAFNSKTRSNVGSFYLKLKKYLLPLKKD